VRYVQKGAELIVNDQRIVRTVSPFVFTFVLSIGIFSPAYAAESGGARTDAATTASVASPASAAAAPTFVTIERDGTAFTYATTARTVRDFLTERDLHVGTGEVVTPGLDESIADGTRIAVRQAIPSGSQVLLSVDRHARVVREVPTTVLALLNLAHVRLGSFDESPALGSRLESNDFVRVAHVKIWTKHVVRPIPVGTRVRTDARLAKGRTRLVAGGRPGLREMTYRYTHRANGGTRRTLVGSCVIRLPHARIVAHGSAVAPSLARIAVQGFESAVHFAGSALHMIATAYAAGCYRCSGITASGVRAGFGVIAVDPRVIPLGTKLFIPGYGRAVAGDTGGAITGNRIDLGMSTNAAAMNYGRHSVTVYVLR